MTRQQVLGSERVVDASGEVDALPLRSRCDESSVAVLPRQVPGVLVSRIRAVQRPCLSRCWAYLMFYQQETKRHPFDPLIHSTRFPTNPLAHLTDDELVGLVVHRNCGACYWAKRIYGWDNKDSAQQEEKHG